MNQYFKKTLGIFSIITGLILSTPVLGGGYYGGSKGEEIFIVQIAGMIARRIVCECQKDQNVNQGDRVGMIRFGSRLDIYYQNFKTLVKENQTTIAGETLIAKI